MSLTGARRIIGPFSPSNFDQSRLADRGAELAIMVVAILHLEHLRYRSPIWPTSAGWAYEPSEEESQGVDARLAHGANFCLE